MRRFPVLLLPLLLACAPARAVAEGADVRFQQLLQTVDTRYSRDEVDAAIPDARERLDSVARDPAALEWPRRRAISLLAMYPDAATRTTLERLAADADESIRAQALMSLAFAFGAAGDEPVVARFVAATQDPSATVRDRAVRALAIAAHPSALQALRGLAMGGQDPQVKALAASLLARRERLGPGRRAPTPVER
jgi:HEAT repeat protein